MIKKRGEKVEKMEVEPVQAGLSQEDMEKL